MLAVPHGNEIIGVSSDKPLCIGITQETMTTLFPPRRLGDVSLSHLFMMLGVTRAKSGSRRGACGVQGSYASA